jgi:hypothetical protein
MCEGSVRWVGWVGRVPEEFWCLDGEAVALLVVGALACLALEGAFFEVVLDVHVAEADAGGEWALGAVSPEVAAVGGAVRVVGGVAVQAADGAEEFAERDGAVGFAVGELAYVEPGVG